MDNSDFGLKNSIHEKLLSVFERFGAVEKVILYGSRAMGNYRNGSDIDLSILGNLADRDFTRLFHDLDDLNLPHMIDLCEYEKIADPHFKSHIDRRGKIFYERSKVLQ